VEATNNSPFVPAHNALPPDAFFALMDEARKEHIPVAVHLPKGVSSAEASDAGVASLEHIETINESALWRKGATAKTVEQAVDENLGPAGQELFLPALREKRNLVRADSRRL
jgi:imidazolonepropionase-like amidohydrolase